MMTVNGAAQGNYTTQYAAAKKNNTKKIVKGVLIGAATVAVTAVAIKNRKSITQFVKNFDAKKTADTIKNTAENAANTIKETVKNPKEAINKGTALATEVAEKFKKGTAECRESIVKTAEELLNSVKKAGNKVTDTTTNLFSGAKVGEGLKNVWTKTADFAKNIWNKAGTVLKKVPEYLGKAKAWIIENSKKAADFFKGFTQKAEPATTGTVTNIF